MKYTQIVGVIALLLTSSEAAQHRHRHHHHHGHRKPQGGDFIGIESGLGSNERQLENLQHGAQIAEHTR